MREHDDLFDATTCSMRLPVHWPAMPASLPHDERIALCRAALADRDRREVSERAGSTAVEADADWSRKVHAWLDEELAARGECRLGGVRFAPDEHGGVAWALDGATRVTVQFGFEPAANPAPACRVGAFGVTYLVTREPRSKWYGRMREWWWLALWALQHPRGMWREWRDR